MRVWIALRRPTATTMSAWSRSRTGTIRPTSSTLIRTSGQPSDLTGHAATRHNRAVGGARRTPRTESPLRQAVDSKPQERQTVADGRALVLALGRCEGVGDAAAVDGDRSRAGCA